MDAAYEVRCSESGCEALEQLPPSLADKPIDDTRRWLIGRAWSSEPDDRYLCPEHW
jgi:hypothetical protein